MHAKSIPPRTWVLALASIASFMVSLDILVVTTALTTIRRDLGASIADLEWTVNAYNLSFAVLLMAAAAFGDRFGRRRVFAAGLGLFTVASAGCALAPAAGWLIAARAVQGAGAALVMPLGMALVSAAYPQESRGRALGIATGVTGLATLAGPLLGGAIAGTFSWQWIFWLNVPIGTLTLPLVFLRIEESFGDDTALDVPGLALVSGAALGIVWALVRVSEAGWASLEVVLPLAVGAVLGVAFVAWELRVREPMLPMRLFRSRAFSAGNLATAFHSAVVLGAVFLMAQFLQTALGLGPLAAGLRLLPWTGTMFVVAPVAGALADRIGPRPVTVLGLAMGATGLGWLSLVAAPGLTYAQVVLPLVITGVGNSMVFPALQSAVVGSMPGGAVGKAAGANTLIRQLGGVLGVAILAAVFAGRGGFGSTEAFSGGFALAMAVGAGLALAGAATGLVVPGRPAAANAEAG